MIGTQSTEKTKRYLVLLAIAAFALPMSSWAQEETQRDYRIGPSDLLEIKVEGAEDVGGELRVSQAGTIAVPLVGELAVAGLTADDLETQLEDRLTTYIRDPKVDVFVREFKRFRFSIMGAVQNPGVYDMSDSLTLLEGLALAGGVEFDDAGGAVMVLRSAATEPITLDLDALFELRSDTFGFELIPGDVIHVVERRTFEVFVRGQVKNAGSFRVEQGTTLLKAITLAGGFDERAAKGRIRIVRMGDSGEPVTTQYNAEKIAEGKSPDVTLEAGDVITVPQTFF